MQRWLYNKISAVTEEERSVLKGLSIDIKRYSESKDFVVTEERISKTKSPLGIRIHSRFAKFPTHSHNFLEIMVVVSGTITHNIGKNSVVLSKGDILIMNKHVRHSIEKAYRHDVGVNLIVTDPLITRISAHLSDTVFSSLIREHTSSDGAPIYMHFRSNGSKTVENLIENLILELTEPCGIDSVAERTLLLFLDYLSIEKDKLFIEGSDFDKKDDERKQKILFYIKNNYTTATLSELSEQFYISSPHLSTKIQDYFGKSFKELLTERRMEKAIELMLNTDLPIVRIIRSVGYESESYFHKEFKKKYGLSPTELRKKCGI